MKSLDVLLATIAANQGTARTFIQQVSQASTLLAQERENFKQTLRALDAAVTTVAKFAVDNREEIVKGVNGTTQLMKTLLTKQNQLTELLRTLPLTLQNLELMPGSALPVRLNPLNVLPGGSLLEGLCAANPAVKALCNLLNGTAPGR